MNILRRWALSRRAFLAAGPAGALVGSTLSPGLAAAMPCGRGAHKGLETAAVGFWPGSERFVAARSNVLLDGSAQLTPRDLEADSEVPHATVSNRLESAEASLGGDPTFLLRGARVGIHGLLTPLEQAVPMAIAIDYAPDQTRRFAAWSLDETEAGPSVSGPISFEVPVVPSAGVSLALALGHDVEAQSFRLSLAPFGQGGKLRRGLYVLAWGKEFALPSWGSLHMAAVDGPIDDEPEEEARQHFRLVRSGGSDFAAVLMSVDYADEPLDPQA